MLEQQFITFLIERIESTVSKSDVAKETQIYIDQLKQVVSHVFETEEPKATPRRRRTSRNEGGDAQ